jgi:hypothetical protein
VNAGSFPKSTVCQRWRARRDSYRPAGETIQTELYHVEPILEDRIAKAFVQEHHYSGSYPAARFRFGLFQGSELQGVAVFSVPCAARVLESAFGDAARDSVELGRFVLLDEVPANGETWFLARCFRGLKREGLAGVLSFSDPAPRTAADGRVTFAGHLGTIYQAASARYLGQARVRTIRLLPDGRTFSARAASKIRAGERGWRYAAAQLELAGAAAPPDDLAELRPWLKTWLPRVTRTLRHPGNHRYAWALAKGVKLPELEPEFYPKALAA